MQRKTTIKAVLLLSSTLTVMSGATIAPSLPQMSEVFAHTPYAAFLSRLILTIPALFIAMCSPFAGYIIDRFGRLRLLLASVLLYAVAGTSGYFLNSLYVILVGRAFLGIAVAGIMTTLTTLIGDYFEGEERSQFMGHRGAFIALGGVVFVGFGGILADIGWRMPFLIYLFSLLIFPLVYFYLPEPTAVLAEEQVDPSIDDYSKKKVQAIYAIAFISMVTFYMVPVQIPFLLKEMGVEKNVMAGLAIVTATLSAIVTSMNYQNLKRRFSYIKMYAIAFLLMGIAYLIISFSVTYAQVIVGLILCGLGLGIMMPNASLWLLSFAPEHRRGRIIGGLATFIFLGQFCSPVIAQPLASISSLHTVFGACGVFMLLLSGAFAWGGERYERRE